jgi:hypothetical protein
MKLTREAFMARPERNREVAGICHRVLRIHPGTGKAVIEPVYIVDHLLPRECEHDRARVVRAGIMAGRYIARCLDCGVGGPVVPGHDDEGTRRLAMGALYAAYPRASFRPVVSERGDMLGWAECMGGIWLGVVEAATRHTLGRYADAGSAVRAVMDWWRMHYVGGRQEPTGCAHCGADPLEVSDACRHCAGMVCEGCALASVYACAERRSEATA